MKQEILELIGYVSSVLILISLLMTSVVKFRVINGVGSLIFTVYAILIHSYPTAVLNACLVAVDVWFLVKGEKKRISQTFGSGDIGFIVSTAPLLQLYEYLLFILISCVASLLWWIIIYWITGKNRTIPFISTSGVCYIGYICSLSFY